MPDDRTLNQKIAEELASGKADLTRPNAPSAIPPPSDDIPSLLRSVKAIKAVLDSMRGVGSSVLDRALTARDLFDAGTLKVTTSGYVTSATPTVTTSSTDPRPVLSTPPAPTGFTATGTLRQVILDWDVPNYANHAYTEIWRDTQSNLATAIANAGNLINQSSASIVTDASVTVSVLYYYWIRHVSTSNVKGPFSSAASAGPSLIGNTDLGPLIVEAGNLASGAVTATKLAAQAVDLTKFANGIEPVTIVTGALPTTKSTNSIFRTDDGKLYRWNGTAYVASVPAGDVTGQLTNAQLQDIAAAKITGTLVASQIADATLTTAKFASNIEPITVVTGALPTAKSTSTIFRTDDQKLYRWNGTAYVASVPAVDVTGQLVASQIADATLTTAKFASSIEPLTVVTGTLPTTKSTNTIFRTDDQKLYRWNGTAYIATVPAADISGTLAAAQIASLAASQITGQLTNAQLAAIDAAKVTGTLTASQLSVSVGGGNLIKNASFEVDSNSDGLPDSWSTYSNGTTGTQTRSLTGNTVYGTYALSLAASGLGTATTDRVGVFQDVPVNNLVGQKFRVSCYTLSVSGTPQFQLYIDYLTSGLAYISSGSGFAITPTTSWARSSTPAETVPATAAWARVYFVMQARAGAAGAAEVRIDGAQFEMGDMVTAFAPKPDEILPNTITATEISDNAVTSAKIIAGAVVAGKIAAGAVSATEIAAGAITTAKLAAGAVTANEIAANTITAAKIASGTITATEIAAGAVSTAKLAAGAVTANEIAAATITGGKIAAGTITGSNIAADTITAGQIAAGAIGATQIAAGSIATDRLLVTGRGDAINDDPNTQDISAWVGSGISIVTDTTSPVGTKVLRATANATVVSRAFPVDPNKNYQLRVWVRQQAGASAAYLTVGFLDASGNNLSGAASGWPSSGTYYYFGVINTQPPSTWTEYRISFGPNETAKIPTTARQVFVGTLANISGSGAQDYTGIRLMLKSDADLIVDGAITADKITTNAVTTTKLAAGAVTANELSAGAVTADKIDANAVTAGKIAAGAVSASQIAAGAITTDKLLVTGRGAALNDDPGMSDAAAWVAYQGSLPTFASITDGVVGSRVARSPGAGAGVWLNVATTKRIPVDPNKSYRLRVWARTVSGSGSVMYVGVALFDSAGNNISGDGTQWSYAGASAVTVPAAWTKYTASYGAGAGNIAFPATARTMSPLVIMSWGGGTSVHEVQDLRIEEMAGADLIVDGTVVASKIAAGAITTAKLDAGAVTADKVGALAITAAKLDAGAVTADKIDANAVTAGKIAAGAVSASQIAAGAITTDKLLVTGRGKAINDDPTFQDVSAWTQGGGSGSYVLVTESTSPVGTKVLRATNDVQFRARSFPITAGAQYKVAMWARRTAGSGQMYLRLYCYDAASNLINFTVTGLTPVTSTFEGIVVPSAWTKYVGYITAGTATVTGALIVHVNWATTGTTDVADCRVEEYIGADLIVDGAIVANKLAANAIAVGTAAIQNGAIVNAMIGLAAVDNAKIADGSITTAKIGDAQITNAKITSLDASKITTGTLDANRIGANSINATQINSNGLTIRDNSGNILFGVSNNLDFSRINPASGWLNSNVGAENMVWGTSFVNWVVTPGNYGGTQFIFRQGGVDTAAYALKPGEQLTISADMWADSTCLAAGQNATLFLWASDAVGNWQAYAAIAGNTSTPTRQSATMTLPSNLSGMAIVAAGIYHQFQSTGTGTPVAGTGYADRVQVERGSSATQYKLGTQPGNLVGSLNPITSGNASTYIANAAINTAQIGDAQVTTLKIGNNQVTVPAGWEATADQSLVSTTTGYTDRITVASIDTGNQPLFVSASLFLSKVADALSADSYLAIFVGTTRILEVWLPGAFGPDRQLYSVSRVVSSPGSGTITVRIATKGAGSSQNIVVKTESSVAAVGCKR